MIARANPSHTTIASSGPATAHASNRSFQDTSDSLSVTVPHCPLSPCRVVIGRTGTVGGVGVPATGTPRVAGTPTRSGWACVTQSGSYARPRRLLHSGRKRRRIRPFTQPIPAAIQASASCDQMKPIGSRNQDNANGICNMLLRPSNSSTRRLSSVSEAPGFRDCSVHWVVGSRAGVV